VTATVVWLIIAVTITAGMILTLKGRTKIESTDQEEEDV
jgi:hypothetical protein